MVPAVTLYSLAREAALTLYGMYLLLASLTISEESLDCGKRDPMAIPANPFLRA